jgi:hypothetical protein
MARIRHIKPETYFDEDLAACSFPARYIFPGLWCLADCKGRLEDRPAWIRAQLLPYDQGINMDELLQELTKGGFITRYTADIDGEPVALIQVNAFSRHQVLSGKEAHEDSRYPAPEKISRGEVMVKRRGSDGEVIEHDREAKGNEGGREGKGREREGIQEPAAESPQPVTQDLELESTPPEDTLEDVLWETFAGFNHGPNGKPQYASFPKEREGNKRLAKLIRRFAPPGEEKPFAKEFLRTFWRLKSSTDRFWRSQPMTPSALSAAGTFERILEELKRRPTPEDLSGDWLAELAQDQAQNGPDAKLPQDDLARSALPLVNRLSSEVMA